MSEDTVAALKGQVEALEGWRKQMLSVQTAADDRLRPLLENVPGALGRHVYEVAADEILRLRREMGTAIDSAIDEGARVGYRCALSDIQKAIESLAPNADAQASEDQAHG